ncbi:MAG: 16S rRNA (adenine(1518)-N(6)/adenine(1519)-N(6))-dimethyltransferase RsmA [Pseudomonadales bacterium]|nr:16S rRNA (adenine(1518)-N(6)/adenine(1519)-N(6))-dimethyltransferase RsmA [Pseudomonadales bacterium]
MAKIRARKRFGQNFLHDKHLIHKIIQTINPQPSDHIIEIGPGHGALTEHLVQSGCNLQVIEIDRDLVAELGLKYPQLNVIQADILKFDFKTIATDTPFRIVGNLPYNISTPLLFKLFKQNTLIHDMHFMMQLEVVDRMIAGHSTPDYGRLSVMTQYYCTVNKMFSVPADAFIPKPKVVSAIVRLAPKNQSKIETNISCLEKIVLQAFSMRRKTIRNALKGFVSEADIITLGLNPKSRPENLSLANYATIANYATQQE